MNRIIIIGASGHGKVVADAAKLMGYTDIVFLDDDASKSECGGYPVIGTTDELSKLQGDVFVAIGDSKIRSEIMEKEPGRRFPVIVHPSAIIARDVKIGDGTVIMAGAVINTGTMIGKGVIVNTSSSIDHDCRIGDYAHISVGSHMAGTVRIGKSTCIGVGAIVSNNISVCGNCVIGAGTVVIRDITKEDVYVGVPAKPIQNKERN